MFHNGGTPAIPVTACSRAMRTTSAGIVTGWCTTLPPIQNIG